MGGGRRAHRGRNCGDGSKKGRRRSPYILFSEGPRSKKKWGAGGGHTVAEIAATDRRRAAGDRLTFCFPRGRVQKKNGGRAAGTPWQKMRRRIEEGPPEIALHFVFRGAAFKKKMGGGHTVAENAATDRRRAAGDRLTFCFPRGRVQKKNRGRAAGTPWQK